VRVGLLGPLQAIGDDDVEFVVGAAKERAVLELLGVRAPSVVTMGELVAALWGDGPPRSATKTLQNYVASLRRLLPAGVIETVPRGYRLAVEADQVDAARFAGLVDRGRRALEQKDTERAVEDLTAALRLWRGEPLLDLADQPTGMAEAARLVELRRAGQEVLVDARLARGEHGSLIGDLEAAVAAEPLRERRWAQLMLALYRSGRQADALRAYQRLRTRLAEELGIEPSPEVRALEAGILNQDRSLQAFADTTAPVVGPAAPAGPGLPSGNVTFVFTDVEGSTGLFRRLGDRYPPLLEEHRRLIRAAMAGHGGSEVNTGGDGLFLAFGDAAEAVAACVDAQRALVAYPWPAEGQLRVRMGVHTGVAIPTPEGDYTAVAVHLAARLAAAGHGGQILMSAQTADLLRHLLPMSSLVHRGLFLLPGFDEAEPIFQLVHHDLPSSFPPLLAAPAIAHNLPDERTSFIGRDTDLKSVDELLRTARLVTLVGPGGAGKTRLAIESGRRLLDQFPAGVWLAELAVLRDPSQVPTAVAKAMGYHDPLAESGGPALVRERLGAAIGPGHLLLLLDNCEHMAEAPAELAAGLLGTCPALVVLATSRQSLGVVGERLVEVGSLDLPTGDAAADVAASAAGALFVDRAQAVHPRFELNPPTAAGVAEVCRRLEGLPLAIELAAAWARLLSPAQIAERLEQTLALPAGGRGREERHHTMRAALAWSYDLLTEAEQELFRRLAVFRSGFVLEAAAAVAPARSADVLSVLGGLVDKSLVEVVDGPAGQRRYRLLEPVRQFAAELLQATGERDDAARRHRDHLLSRLQGPRPDPSAFAGLAAELDNVRAAVEHAMSTSEPEAAVVLVNAYGWWWMDLGLHDEQFERLGEALRVADRSRISVAELSVALSDASYTATQVGRFSEAASFADQLAELRDQHPEMLTVRADWAWVMADLEWFRAGSEQSHALRVMQQSQHTCEACGVISQAASTAAKIASAAILWDRVGSEVADAISDCIALSKTVGWRGGVLTIRVFASVIELMREENDAYQSCLKAFAELEALDSSWLAEWTSMYVGMAAELVNDHAVATAHSLRLVRFCRRSGLRTLLTCGIRAAARLAAREGHAEQSLRLWGGAERIEADIGLRDMPLINRLDGPLRQQCTAALGPDATRLLAEGASWSVAEATQAAEEALLALQAETRMSEPNRDARRTPSLSNRAVSPPTLEDGSKTVIHLTPRSHSDGGGAD
jgi:predicted ATPase/DNA-binding SARP family transcriptional activator